jgi:hypothetical protein
MTETMNCLVPETVSVDGIDDCVGSMSSLIPESARMIRAINLWNLFAVKHLTVY